MGNLEMLELIKDSFERWYNKHCAEKPVSVVINYSDTQTLAIKAFHTVTVEVKAIGIRDNLSWASTLFTYKENYNHGITTEDEAKKSAIQGILGVIYDYVHRS